MSVPFNPNEEPTKSGKPNVTVQGRVEKIIVSSSPSVPEKAEISIEGADELYREIRIDNTLTGKDGDEVRLKQGAEVEVTIEADENATTPDSTRK
jgi:hypothetical protein